jgi:hypothetical protein
VVNDATDRPDRDRQDVEPSVFSAAEPGATARAESGVAFSQGGGVLPPTGLTALIRRRRGFPRFGWSGSDAQRPPPGLRARDDGMSRGLILLWCLWLLGSWTVTLVLDPSLASERKVRWMMMASLVGLTLVWPVLRLSQDASGSGAPGSGTPGIQGDSAGSTSGRGAWGVLRDWVSLNVVFQAVIWPLRLQPQWSLEQALWLDLAVAGWSLVTAGLMALGVRRGGGWWRAGWTLACVALWVSGPLWLALTGAGGDWSPLLSVWRLSGPALLYRPGQGQTPVLATLFAAVLLWTVVAMTHRRRRPTV